MDRVESATSDGEISEILDTLVREQQLPVQTRTNINQIRFCEKCQIIKPDRCHHCSVCGTCILKMDHHCRTSLVVNFNFEININWIVLLMCLFEFYSVGKQLCLFRQLQVLYSVFGLCLFILPGYIRLFISIFYRLLERRLDRTIRWKIPRAVCIFCRLDFHYYK